MNYDASVFKEKANRKARKDLDHICGAAFCQLRK